MNNIKQNQRLIEQIMKKYIFEDDPHAIIGTEIRLRRNGQCKTLDALCLNTCSVSYLSKIEKNEIKPNPTLLEEICKRLSLSKESLEIINNSKLIFDDIIKAAFDRDFEVIKKSYFKVKQLKNYRARLIEFYYFVMNDDLRASKELFLQLDKLVGSMLLNDLIIFAYTEAVYHVKLNQLQEAYSLVTGLERLTLPFKYLDCLIKELKVEILYKINSNLFLANSQNLKNLYMKYNAYNKMNYIDKMIKLYMVRNGYFALLDLSEDNAEDHDFLLYEEIANGEELHGRTGYSKFARLLYLKLTKRNSYDKEYHEEEDNLNSTEILVLNVIGGNILSNEYYQNVMEIYYPMALAMCDEIIISFVENELVKLLQYKKRYKRIIDIYANGEKRRKEAGFFC